MLIHHTAKQYGKQDEQLALVLGQLWAAYHSDPKPEIQSTHYYRGYLEALNDISKIMLHKDMEK